jgi:hypothetical protein
MSSLSLSLSAQVLTYCVEEKSEDNASLWSRMQLLQEETVRKLSTPVQVRPEDIKNGALMVIGSEA